MIRHLSFGDNKEKLVTNCMLDDLQATKHVLNQLCNQTEGLECAFTAGGLWNVDTYGNHYTGTRIQHFQKVWTRIRFLRLRMQNKCIRFLFHIYHLFAV